MRILVIEAHGLPTGFIGCYGNDWIATPNLDRLAAQGVVFDGHLVPEPGRPLREFAPGSIAFVRHAARTLEEFKQLAGALDRWLASETPVLLIEGADLAPPWTIAGDMLEVYFDEEDELQPWPNPPDGEAELTADDQVRLQNTFGAVVTYWDALVGSLLAHLGPRLEEMIVCVTASAGLPLGEHDVIGYGRPWLHEELVHVPLIVRLPAGAHGGERMAALTQPGDLWPALAHWLGQAAGPGVHSLIDSEVELLHPEVQARWSAGGGSEQMARSLAWAFLLPGQAAAGRTPQLYVKPEDRWEMNNVAQHHPELVETLEKKLRDTPGEVK